MSNAFSLSSKGSGCLIFAPNYLTNCVTYYGAKIIHQDSLEDCKKVLDIKRPAVFLPASHCVNHSIFTCVWNSLHLVSPQNILKLYHLKSKSDPTSNKDIHKSADCKHILMNVRSDNMKMGYTVGILVQIILKFIDLQL